MQIFILSASFVNFKHQKHTGPESEGGRKRQEQVGGKARWSLESLGLLFAVQGLSSSQCVITDCEIVGKAEEMLWTPNSRLLIFFQILSLKVSSSLVTAVLVKECEEDLILLSYFGFMGGFITNECLPS